jgi:hypothetical protein
MENEGVSQTPEGARVSFMRGGGDVARMSRQMGWDGESPENGWAGEAERWGMS